MTNKIYRIIFLHDTKVYELYAKYLVSDLEMYGFVEVGDFVFSNNSGILVDPTEEKLRTEFAGVKKTYIPIQSIYRIDEVEKEGVAKISDSGKPNGNVHQFPTSSFSPDVAPRR